MTTKSSLADECSCSDTEDCERCKRLYAAGDRWLEDNGVKGLGMLLEENAALEKQRDDLQAANTAEVERRRKAEGKASLFSQLVKDHGWTKASVRETLRTMGFERPDALPETTKPKMDFTSDATEDSVSDTVSWERSHDR